MTRSEYEDKGWSIVESDHNQDDVLDQVNVQLRQNGLVLNICDEECDGFLPIKLALLKGK